MYARTLPESGSCRFYRPIILACITLILAALIVPSALFASPINAGEEDGRSENVNPFPDKAPDSYFDEHSSVGMPSKRFIERNGKSVDFTDKWYAVGKPGDILHIYGAFQNSQRGSSVGGQIAWSSMKTAVDAEGRYVGTEWVNHYLTATNVLLNNRPWARFDGRSKQVDESGSEEKMWFSTHSELFFNPIVNRQYFSHDTKIPGDFSYIRFDSSMKSGGSHAGTNFVFVHVFPMVSATFHPVLESDYRAARGLGATDPITARSDGDKHHSVKPFKALDIKDIDTAYTSYSVYKHDKGDSPEAKRDIKSPLYLADDVDPSTKDKDHEAYELLKDALTSDDIGAPRPKLGDLLKERAGYVIAGDDIDRVNASDPEHNNGYLSIATEGDKYYYDKHYYVVYRPVPASVKITKVDDKTKAPLTGGSYALYAKKADGPMVLVKNGLTAKDGVIVNRADGTTYDTLKQVATAGPATLADGHGYAVDNDGLALVSGTYELVESEAPAGYAKLETPVTFEVKTNPEDQSTYLVDVEVTNTEKSVTPPTEPTEQPTPGTPTPQPTPDPNPGVTTPNNPSDGNTPSGDKPSSQGDTGSKKGQKVSYLKMPKTGDESVGIVCGVLFAVAACAGFVGVRATTVSNNRRTEMK